MMMVKEEPSETTKIITTIRPSMDAIRRNLWTRKETNALLKIFKERNVVNLLLRKANSPVKIFTMVENQMVNRGFTQKSTLQIMRKWKKLKSTYSVKYRPKAGCTNETKIPYFKEIHELMTGRIFPGDVHSAKEFDDMEELFTLDGENVSLPATLTAAQLKCRADEKRNLWNNDETIAMLNVFHEYNVASSLKCMRKGNMEVYEMVAEKMAERGYNRKNSTQIRIKWKRLKSCYNKYKRGKPQDVIRSEEVMQLLQTICDANDLNSDQCITASLTNLTNNGQVFQPEFEFETVAILDDSVSLVPDDVDGTTHHIITTHTPEIINTQDYDQTHIYTTSSTDKLRAAIPSGIVDTNEVTIETTSYESGTNMYDENQSFLQQQESTHIIPEPNVSFQSTAYAAETPTYATSTSTHTMATTKELQDDYFRQQRELIAFKYELKAEMQRKTFSYILDGTKQLVNEVKQDLFAGLKDFIEQLKKT